MAGIEVTGKYNNKVVYGTTVLVDLTSDTVTESTLAKGVTAHDKTGASITGTLTAPTEQSKTVDLAMASGNQTIIPDSSKTLSQVTVTKPTTMVSENIKKGINIGGVMGALESGEATKTETWILNESPKPVDNFIETQIKFLSNGTEYNTLAISANVRRMIYFDSTLVYGEPGGWSNILYRKIIFQSSPTGDLLTWLESNAIKQDDNIAVQPTKSVSITTNGTTNIMSDEPYDVMKNVEVVTNVSSSGISIEDNTYIISSVIKLSQTIIDGETSVKYAVNFTSNGASFTSLNMYVLDDSSCIIHYGAQRVGTAYWSGSNEYGYAITEEWEDEAYRKIIITDAISVDFEAWLYDNAVKLNDFL